ncbi:hypothetical protein HI914_05097 [Erysiphe necator]|nr:hypothetical protein HI914_05097 [Erysiphe necator]
MILVKLEFQKKLIYALSPSDDAIRISRFAGILGIYCSVPKIISDHPVLPTGSLLRNVPIELGKFSKKLQKSNMIAVKW